jgi:glyoxylase-like metal-dependent hydrolase (beta-lactamase superfamily II)
VGTEASSACARSIRFGDVRITVLCDFQLDLSVWNDLPAPSQGWPSLCDRYPWAFDGPTLWRFHGHAYLVKTPEATVLVDTGGGPRSRLAAWVAWGFPRSWAGAVVPRSEGLPASLGIAGETVGSVDHVVLTHLHLDHSGWALAAGGAPMFPRALYHVSAIDWEWMRTGVDEELRRQFQGSLRSLVDSDRLLLADDTFEVVPGVHILPVPGHTPGHRAVLIGAGDRHVVLSGDLLHHPIQLADPDWSGFDEDEPVARGARRNLIARAADHGWVVAPTHFGDPFGTLVAEGGGFAWRSYPEA